MNKRNKCTAYISVKGFKEKNRKGNGKESVAQF